MSQTSLDTRFASWASDVPLAEPAVEQVLTQVRERLSGNADLALLFATSHHQASLEPIVRRVREALQPRVLIGLTAQGTLGAGQEIESGAGLSLLAAQLPTTELRPFTLDDIDLPGDPTSPEALHERLAGDADVRAIVLFADPFSAPMLRLLPALSEAFPGVPVVGGMASAGREAGANRLVLDQHIRDSGVVGVAIAGDVRADTTVSQGCRPIGWPLVITRARRHIIQELGGRSALDAIREVAQSLNDADRELLEAHGLLVGRVVNEYKPRFGRGDFLIRNVVGVDPKAGYLAIADPQVRVGQTIQFHLRDARAAVEDFELLLEAQKLHGAEGGALLVSCNGRGSGLFGRPNADAEMVERALPGMPLAGFFAAGEIGPIGGRNHLHGHTASLLVLRPPDPTL